MTGFEINIIINSPIEIVTEALTNPHNFVYWTTDLEKFEVIKGESNKVGAIANLHYSRKGHKYIMEDKLIFCEPGKKYISVISGDTLSAKVETTLQSVEDKTKLLLKWKGKGKIFVLKLLLPFLRFKIANLAKKDFETFKQLVEERGIDFAGYSKIKTQ